jgi:DNA-binding GntR family transcriptional regulator
MTAASNGRLRALRPVTAGTSVVDRTAAEIRRAVLAGDLPAGEEFSIVKMASALGVSHIPVREALRQLHAEGLVVIRPGRSAMVSNLSRDEIRSIYRLRQLIEPDLAARSTALLTATDLEHIDALLEEYGDADESGDELWQCHHDLHLSLLAPAASEWDMRMLQQLWHAADRYLRPAFDTHGLKPSERQRRKNAHRPLVAAARSGSPAEARAAYTEHLAENEKTCLERLAALPSTRS